jgi:hypothetical protein
VPDELVKFGSPLYVAVTVCVPMGMSSVVTDTVPDAPSGAVNVGPPPLTVNVTVPVGVPDPGATAATVAVSVTGSPKTDDDGDVVTEVVVAAWFTFWKMDAEEGSRFASPL